MLGGMSYFLVPLHIYAPRHTPQLHFYEVFIRLMDKSASMGHGHKYEYEYTVYIIVLLTSPLYKRIVYAWGLLVALVTALCDNKFHTLYVGNISLFSTPSIRRKYPVSITPVLALLYSRHQY